MEHANAQVAQPSVHNEVTEVVVYQRNLSNPFVKQSIHNFLTLTQTDANTSLVASPDMEQNEAFAALARGEIDIIVSAPTRVREALANMVAVPLDRCLLGFRLCMVHQDSPPFIAISNPAQFIQANLSVGLGADWVDRFIYQENGFTVVSSTADNFLYGMLSNKRFDCFTRSVSEIQDNLRDHLNESLAIDQKLVFIYPNGDFIFVNPKKPALFERLQQGVNMAIEDGSYYDVFDEYFAGSLQSHRIFERKLIFLSNNELSENALQAINHYGIASFIIPK